MTKAAPPGGVLAWADGPASTQHNGRKMQAMHDKHADAGAARPARDRSKSRVAHCAAKTGDDFSELLAQKFVPSANMALPSNAVSPPDAGATSDAPASTEDSATDEAAAETSGKHWRSGQCFVAGSMLHDQLCGARGALVSEPHDAAPQRVAARDAVGLIAAPSITAAASGSTVSAARSAQAADGGVPASDINNASPRPGDLVQPAPPEASTDPGSLVRRSARATTAQSETNAGGPQVLHDDDHETAMQQVRPDVAPDRAKKPNAQDVKERTPQSQVGAAPANNTLAGANAVPGAVVAARGAAITRQVADAVRAATVENEAKVQGRSRPLAIVLKLEGSEHVQVTVRLSGSRLAVTLASDAPQILAALWNDHDVLSDLVATGTGVVPHIHFVADYSTPTADAQPGNGGSGIDEGRRDAAPQDSPSRHHAPPRSEETSRNAHSPEAHDRGGPGGIYL